MLLGSGILGSATKNICPLAGALIITMAFGTVLKTISHTLYNMVMILEMMSGYCLKIEVHTRQNCFKKRALRIIRTHKKTKPLFLYLPFQSVHAPLQVPEVYKDMYANTTGDVNRATLLGMVTAMDDAVGNITAVLKKKGMFENTLMVFLSDNGAPVANSGSNWPLRGSKHTLFEGGTRVPAFVSGLGLEPRVESRLFHISDWLPTILTAVNPKNHMDNVDGMSHWKALVNKSSSWSRSEILYNIDNFRSDHETPISAIRVGDWKYIWREKGSWQGWYLAVYLSQGGSLETET
jgi:arylsulfatase B